MTWDGTGIEATLDGEGVRLEASLKHASGGMLVCRIACGAAERERLLALKRGARVRFRAGLEGYEPREPFTFVLVDGHVVG